MLDNPCVACAHSKVDSLSLRRKRKSRTHSYQGVRLNCLSI